MAHDPEKTPLTVPALQGLSGPWALFVASAVVAIAGAGLALADVELGGVLVTSTGVILASGALAWRLRRLTEELADKVDAASLTAAFVVLAFGASWVITPHWDSLGLVFAVVGALGCVGVLLVLLPPSGRKVVASLLLLFHFGGIFTAVTAVPLRN